VVFNKTDFIIVSTGLNRGIAQMYAFGLAHIAGSFGCLYLAGKKIMEKEARCFELIDLQQASGLSVTEVSLRPTISQDSNIF